MTDDEEIRNWTWLGEDLGRYRERIKQKVTALYASDAATQLPLRFYTSHDLSHCEAVENLLHRLIPTYDDFKDLKERERFYLLAAAWLHDIGMLRVVADKVSRRRLSDAEIRRCHHETTRKFIKNFYVECGVEECDRHFLADLCFYHRKQEDLRRANEKMVVLNVEYSLRLLAAYLRLADALHVDTSRTPERDFLLSLAYNIPPETKIHWIKSRLVSGIGIDARRHRIKVQLQLPSEADLRELVADDAGDPSLERRVHEKVEAVVRHVVDELRDELASVLFVLSTGGSTYYLDIETSRAGGGVDQRTLTHLMTMAMNYDVLVWPSATRLQEMTLVNLAEIAGFQLRHGREPLPLPDDGAGNRAQSLRSFLGVLRDDVLGPRSGHLGFRSLFDRCRKLVNVEPFDVDAFVRMVNAEYQQQEGHRTGIRHHAAEGGAALPLPDDRVCCVVLYGYSELVIKALCGLRDRLLLANGLAPRKLYGTDAELEYSRRFHVFICEGQPKTHTSDRDRLLYHDGIAYALALRQHNFTNLVIVPDAVLSAIVRHHRPDVLLVGTNGFDDTSFRHSAGHGSVIYLLRALSGGATDGGIRVVLVASSDKYVAGERVAPEPGRAPAAASATAGARGTVRQDSMKLDGRDVEGYWFWAGAGEPARDSIWFSRDERKRAELRQHHDHIQFFNPRDDILPIAVVDTVVSDCGAYPIRGPPGTSEQEVQQNIERFLREVRQTQDDARAKLAARRTDAGPDLG